MIRKLKWKNHDLLGDLELDFTDNKGIPYPNIVIAGENGTGKTTILSTLANFLNRGTMLPFDFIECDINGKTYKLYYESESDGGLGFHKRENLSNGSIENVQSNINNNSGLIDKDNEDIRKYGVVYSTARSGFQTNPVKGSSTEQIDSNKYDIDANGDFTPIKQLLVDIDVQDNSEWNEISKKKGINDVKYEEFQSKSRLSRFTNAFNHFFEYLKFDKIDNSSSKEKEILFVKSGKNIPVDKLSTGEKQIVFRGAQLLRNVRAVENGIFLIDEPELSMHPRWQDKILDFYIDISKGGQSQRIIATHSEYVLRTALKRTDTLVVVLNYNNGKIEAKRITAPNVLPTITFAETRYIAYGIPSTDYHIELYGYLQVKECKDKIFDCDQFIKNSHLFDPAKHTKASTYTANGRTYNYNTLPTYIRNAIDHPNNGNDYTDEELETSIKLLIELCK